MVLALHFGARLSSEGVWLRRIICQKLVLIDFKLDYSL
jgi:hypothetical protein